MSTITASKLLYSPLPDGWSICFDTDLRQGVYLFEGSHCDAPLMIGVLSTAKGTIQITHQIVSSIEANALQITIHQESSLWLVHSRIIKAKASYDWLVSEFDVTNTKEGFVIQISKLDENTFIKAKISSRIEGY